jgi:hypothetical protein
VGKQARQRLLGHFTPFPPCSPHLALAVRMRGWPAVAGLIYYQLPSNRPCPRRPTTMRRHRIPQIQVLYCTHHVRSTKYSFQSRRQRGLVPGDGTSVNQSRPNNSRQIRNEQCRFIVEYQTSVDGTIAGIVGGTSKMGTWAVN